MLWFFFTVWALNRYTWGWKWWRWLWISTRWERSSSRFSRLSLQFIASLWQRKRSLEILLQTHESRRWTVSSPWWTVNQRRRYHRQCWRRWLHSHSHSRQGPSKFSILSFSATKQCIKHFVFYFFELQKNLLKFMDLLQLYRKFNMLIISWWFFIICNF